MRLTALSSFAFAGVLLLSGCEKARLDEQVRQLCAKDGGIKIYETVVLPPDQFDKWGMVTFYKPTQGEKALGQDYLFEHDVYFYKTGNPQMSRDRYRIVRRSDGKLLGEATIYGRGGGDGPVPLPIHDSSFHCPSTSEVGDVKLIQRVFVKSS